MPKHDSVHTGFVKRRGGRWWIVGSLLLVVVVGFVADPADGIASPPVGDLVVPGWGAVNDLRRLPKQDVMIVGTGDGVVRFWDLESRKIVGELKERFGPVVSVAADANERWVAAAYRDKAIVIWDAKTRTLLNVLRHDSFDARTHILAGPDAGMLVVYGHQNALSVWKISTGREEQTLKGHEARVHAAAMTEDGSILVSGDTDDNVIVWDVKSGKISHRLRSGQDDVASITFLGASRRFATGAAYRGGIKVWDALEGKLVKVFGETKQKGFWALCSSSDGKRLSAGVDKGAVEVWDVELGKRVRLISAHNSIITGTGFSRDGTLIVTSCGGWDFRDKQVDGHVRAWKTEGE
jgi:WD40 repeat protein